MSLKEYSLKVSGYRKTTEIRRSEMTAGLWPIYQAVMAQLGKGNKITDYEDYIPFGPREKKEPIVDDSGLLKKRFERMNPHVNMKEYYDRRRNKITNSGRRADGGAGVK